MDHLPLHHPAKMIGFMRFHHLAGDPFGIVPFDEFLDSKGAMFPRAVINSKNLEPRTGFVRVGEDDGGHGDWLSRRRHSLLSVLPCSNSGSPPFHYSPVSRSKGGSPSPVSPAKAARPQNSIGGLDMGWSRSLVDWQGWKNQGRGPSPFAGIAETELTLWRDGTY